MTRAPAGGNLSGCPVCRCRAWDRYLESILWLGAYLKIDSENLDGFCFIVAADAMQKGGRTSPEAPNCGTIHLHAAGRAAWARPMRVKLEELGIPSG